MYFLTDLEANITKHDYKQNSSPSFCGVCLPVLAEKPEQSLPYSISVVYLLIVQVN